MWARCKNPSNKDYPNYKDCKIDERYRLLSNYVNDVMQLDNFDLLCLYPNEYHVDKDKLDPKVYNVLMNYKIKCDVDFNKFI